MRDDQIDRLDADERRDDAAEAVNEQIPAQQGRRPKRAIADAAQRERHERDDDQCVEDHRGQNRGLRRFQSHDVQYIELGKRARKHGGNDGEIFRHVVGHRERRERAARDQELLADLNDFDQLGRVGIEIDHVAGFFRGLRSGVHGESDVGLREGGRVVGAVTGHGDKLPLGLFPADEREFVFRLGLRQEIIKAGLAGDGRGGERIVSGDHHRANTHGAELIEALAHAALDDVLQVNRAENVMVFGHEQRRAAGIGNCLDGILDFGRDAIAVHSAPLHDRVERALANFTAIEIDAGHARDGGERNEICGVGGKLAATEIVFFLGEHHDRAALGSFIRK